jgi:hypothetical protein
VYEFSARDEVVELCHGGPIQHRGFLWMLNPTIYRARPDPFTEYFCAGDALLVALCRVTGFLFHLLQHTNQTTC